MRDYESWRACYERATAVADEAIATCNQLRLIIEEQQHLLESQQRTLTLAINTLESYSQGGRSNVCN